jgi:SAM-dependent methyltransferase
MEKVIPSQAQRILLDHLDLLAALDRTQPVLDLACGKGRNGLVLAQHGIPVVFADRSAASLEVVKQYLEEYGLAGRVWKVDLEQPGINPFSGQTFNAVIGFNYLHRPLFPALMDAVKPGGLVVYETFTIENRSIGRPVNPDFLLQTGELKTIFQDWDVIFHFEGLRHCPDRAVAQIVARKPHLAFGSGS